MINLKRFIQAFVFVSLHAAIAILIMLQVDPAWVAGCGVMAAAFATLLLFLFAGDEQSAKLFFFENWDELEKEGSLNLGFVFVVIAAIWVMPVLCFFLALIIVFLTRSG